VVLEIVVQMLFVCGLQKKKKKKGRDEGVWSWIFMKSRNFHTLFIHKFEPELEMASYCTEHRQVALWRNG